MDIFYLDEQYGKVDGRKFTAINAAVINSSKINGFREKFYSGYSKILKDGHRNALEGLIRPLPILHGSEILPNYDDKIKIASLRLLLHEFEEYGGRFLRLGYYDDQLPKTMNGNANKLNMIVTNLLMGLPKGYDEEFALVHEFDREAVKKGLNSQDENLSVYYQIGKENISIPLATYVGHFFAIKGDLGCQVADVGCFLSFKATSCTPQSEFAKQLISVHRDFEHLYSYDEIISMEWLDSKAHPKLE